MQIRVSGPAGRVLSRALIGLTVLAGATAVASAQTTITLNQPGSQVVSATVRGGKHADKNDQSLLATRSAEDLEYNRRAMLKFDTQNTIPAGSAVTSATMTVTVKTGSEDGSRRIGVYQVTTSWSETEVTWNERRKKEKWANAGGDLGSKIAEAVVSNVAGSKVTFDVTPLVKMAVAGSLGSSRYTRIVLVDMEGSTSESYREFVTPTDGNTAARPALKVTYGGSSTPTPTPTPDPTPAPAPTPSSTNTLRVLHWNTHHGGVGTDGIYDPSRLIKKVASFKPDVVSLNEVEHYGIDQPALFASLMKQYTGVTWYYKYTSGTGSQSGIGNMVMSRMPFDTSAIQPLSYTRAIVNATIHVNGRIVNISSTHLDDASGSARIKEIGELSAWARGFAEQRIICGDFNAWPGSSENATMKGAYYDSWAEAQADGTAIAYPGNTVGNTRNSRIDYIYYSKGAGSLVLQSSQVFDTRDSNGVMPSDHRPVLSIFTVK
jgi:endonuclease/exonuclease/phosphatase family metal-dependent hydrolase